MKSTSHFGGMPNIVATFEAGKLGRHLALNGHIDWLPVEDGHCLSRRIAVACGFTEALSHASSRGLVGTSPAAWRRLRQG
jgi:hypothetical protein